MSGRRDHRFLEPRVFVCRHSLPVFSVQRLGRIQQGVSYASFFSLQRQIFSVLLRLSYHYLLETCAPLFNYLDSDSTLYINFPT